MASSGDVARSLVVIAMSVFIKGMKKTGRFQIYVNNTYGFGTIVFDSLFYSRTYFY